MHRTDPGRHRQVRVAEGLEIIGSRRDGTALRLQVPAVHGQPPALRPDGVHVHAPVLPEQQHRRVGRLVPGELDIPERIADALLAPGERDPERLAHGARRTVTAREVPAGHRLDRAVAVAEDRGHAALVLAQLGELHATLDHDAALAQPIGEQRLGGGLREPEHEREPRLGGDRAVVEGGDELALLAHLGAREPHALVEERRSEPELVEDLEGPGLEPGCLAQGRGRVRPVDDPAAHPVVIQHDGECEPDRTGADDEDRDLLHRRGLDPPLGALERSGQVGLRRGDRRVDA